MSEKKEYIERGALIEKLKEKITTNYLNLYDEDTLESIIRFAEKQPAADVEPVVRGTWINDEDYPDSGLKVCSTCGHDPLLNGHEERVLSKRCPNCGAHMSTERSGSGE